MLYPKHSSENSAAIFFNPLSKKYVGNGTTKTALYVDEVGTKAIIYSVISDDKIKQAMEFLNDKFKTIKNGKGVAFTVPFTRVMGVQFFNFLSNNKSTLI